MFHDEKTKKKSNNKTLWELKRYALFCWLGKRSGSRGNIQDIRAHYVHSISCILFSLADKTNKYYNVHRFAHSQSQLQINTTRTEMTVIRPPTIRYLKYTYCIPARPAPTRNGLQQSEHPPRVIAISLVSTWKLLSHMGCGTLCVQMIGKRISAISDSDSISFSRIQSQCSSICASLSIF